MKKSSDIYNIDKFIALKPVNSEGLKWFLPFESPLRLSGFAWFGRDMKYNRFPAAGLPETLSQFDRATPAPIKYQGSGVQALAEFSAGGQVQFRTDSRRIVLRGKMLAPGGMDHMAFTGSGGFDLYAAEDGQKMRMVKVSRFDHNLCEFSAELIDGLTRKMREMLIFFPLYNGVSELFIGFDDDAAVEAPAAWSDDRPVAAYGTSILQGGCASRPGMAYTNILSRRLNMPVLNFGFSGNGKGEKEIAAILASLADPAMYILDYDWNIGSPEAMAATLPCFIDILRDAHPGVPLLVVSHTPDGPASLTQQNPAQWAERTAVQRDEVARRRAAGDSAIEFIDGATLLGEDWDECLVDGCHATDLGFYRMAQNICPAVCRLLKKK